MAGMRLAAQFQGYSPGGIIDMDGDISPEEPGPEKAESTFARFHYDPGEKSSGPTVSNAGLQIIPRRTGSS